MPASSVQRALMITVSGGHAALGDVLAKGEPASFDRVGAAAVLRDALSVVEPAAVLDGQRREAGDVVRRHRVHALLDQILGRADPGAGGLGAWWQALLALAVLLGAAALIVRAAARLYQRSLLQTQGRLSLRQAWSTPE